MRALATRRAFLRVASISPAAALVGCPFSFEQGYRSTCGRAFSDATAAVVARSWEGLRAERCWDVHAHLLGNGLTDPGIWATDDLRYPKSFEGRLRHFFFANASCSEGEPEELDTRVLERLRHLVTQLPAGARLMLLAFEFAYDHEGRIDRERTTFSVSDDYARRIAQSDRDRFEWIASIHPYDLNAARRLAAAHAGGARAVKWLPPSMNIDLRDRRTLEFAEAAAKIGMPLLIHLGAEQAVPGAGRHELANPWHVEILLKETRVRVIAAHCASLGETNGQSNFSIFESLMKQTEYEGRLFGDISAVTQLNRHESIVPRILAHREWEGRLLNGSDYPLPGIMPLFSLDRMVKQGILDAAVVPALRELRHTNALLFDFVLKRNLGFANGVFETREFFGV